MFQTTNQIFIELDYIESSFDTCQCHKNRFLCAMKTENHVCSPPDDAAWLTGIGDFLTICVAVSLWGSCLVQAGLESNTN